MVFWNRKVHADRKSEESESRSDWATTDLLSCSCYAHVFYTCMPILKRTILCTGYPILCFYFACSLFVFVRDEWKRLLKSTGVEHWCGRAIRALTAWRGCRTFPDGSAGRRDTRRSRKSSADVRSVTHLIFKKKKKCKVCCDCDEQTIFHETTPSAQPASHAKQRYARTFAHAGTPSRSTQIPHAQSFNHDFHFPRETFLRCFIFPSSSLPRPHPQRVAGPRRTEPPGDGLVRGAGQQGAIDAGDASRDHRQGISCSFSPRLSPRLALKKGAFKGSPPPQLDPNRRNLFTAPFFIRAPRKQNIKKKQFTHVRRGVY